MMDRREFAKLAGAGAAGLAAWPLDLFAADEAPAVEGDRHEKMAWWTYRNHADGSGTCTAEVVDPSPKLLGASVWSLYRLNSRWCRLETLSGPVLWSAETGMNCGAEYRASLRSLRIRLEFCVCGYARYLVSNGVRRELSMYEPSDHVDFLIARLSALASELPAPVAAESEAATRDRILAGWQR